MRVVPAGDEAALGAALTAILAEGPVARADAQTLSRHVLDRYSWDEATTTTIQVYERARRGPAVVPGDADTAITPATGSLRRERVIRLPDEDSDPVRRP